MKLFLDTTDNLRTLIKLDGEEFIKTHASPHQQDVLGYLSQILKKKLKDFKDISSIEVNPGPGSFTGTRVGVAIANALAFALDIKVNGQNPPISAIYSYPPNIT
ncbi:hypothetical protein HY333_01175 [Candidatus Collierbacteria bacterium]|nr:hypothetical protein [Candidatus Collierbacteria bacterium]